ncbi:hypothetical protein ACP70R_016183 [Stipagrostis hirtigluma subsp. patula]
MAPPAAAAAAMEPDSSATSSGAVQLLLRNIDSRTSVIRARREETLDEVLGRLGKVGARGGQIRVVYAGRELRREATIGELGLPPDATLHVTSRLLSTPYAGAWDLASEIVAAARARLAATRPPGDAAASLEELIRRFLKSAATAHQGTSPSSLGAVDDHLDIFLRSGAPGVLVQLYLSKDAPRRAAAESAIRCFLRPDPPTGPSVLLVWMAPLLMEFCRLIAASARRSDPLYAELRGVLAAVLSSPDWTLPRSPDVPPEWVAEQVTRFAQEMADTIMEELAGAYSSMTAAARNLVEFRVFWSVLRHQVHELDADKLRRPWWTALSETLMSLLSSIDKCMARFEMRLSPPPSLSAPPKWATSLPTVWGVLAELDAWSELDSWPELRHALRATLAAHTAAVTALVLGAGREWNQKIRWITRHRDVLTFEARRHLAMAMLPEPTAGSVHGMRIDRSQLLPESFACIASSTRDELRRYLSVEFKHEQATGPGVLREWFCLVCQELFNPRLPLFSACPHDRRRFFINPKSVVDPLHLQYFKFSGQMIALALVYKIQVGVLFDRTFFLQLAGRSITLDDIVDADPSLHASCKKILEMDPSLVDSNALGLTFVREVDMLGSRTITELFQGGKDIAVTSENRCKYIDLLIQDSFVNCTRRQLGYFAEGFISILGEWKLKQEFFESLVVDDFDQILGGSKGTIDVKEWKAHTDYTEYRAKDRQINWFWKVVESMTAEQRSRLLFFWTAVKYLPSDGFRGLASRLTICRASVSRDHLPMSRTCFFHLSLPAYTSLNMMQSRLQMIVQEHVISGFGAS